MLKENTVWDCPECGCQGVAGDLLSCPQCRKERTMPKTTVAGGGSNADDPEEVAARAAAVASAEADAVVVEAAADVPKAELKERARDAGLPVSGNKAELAQSLADAARTNAGVKVEAVADGNAGKSDA